MVFADVVVYVFDQLSSDWSHGLAKMAHESEPTNRSLFILVCFSKSLDLEFLEEKPVFIESLYLRWGYFLEMNCIHIARDFGVVLGHGAIDGPEVG